MLCPDLLKQIDYCINRSAAISERAGNKYRFARIFSRLHLDIEKASQLSQSNSSVNNKSFEISAAAHRSMHKGIVDHLFKR